MLKKIVNILIIESVQIELDKLLGILRQPQHNIFIARSSEEAISIIQKKEIEIIIFDLDITTINGPAFVNKLTNLKASINSNIIITSRSTQKVYDVIDNLSNGAVDYLIKPWIPNLVNTKISVYKKLYFKRQKVHELLENILPAHTLEEFKEFGKSSPKKHKNATVLFTDFVKFSEKTRHMNPQELIKRLDFYFSHFDQIMQKYNLEKIKTIGDAYMAIGGVTEDSPHAVIRTALAALDMQNFIKNDILTKKALGQDYWEIRIGMHTGDLVAGIVGTHKFSYDVWGDTVNVAARCEQNSEANKISVSEVFYEEIKEYFECTSRGDISIKNRGNLSMYFIDRLKEKYSFYGEGKLPNVDLRILLGLPKVDFKGLRSFILNKIKAELDEALIYHSYEHTLNVEKSVLRYAQLEGLNKEETLLVRTAALFHDTGFILKYHNNESVGAELFKRYASDFGYSQKDIDTICQIILSTSYDIEPQNLMEMVMSDADHDYLGRSDYHSIASKLFLEIEYFGKKMSEVEKIESQIEYLKNKHKYYTASAINLRQPGKLNRIDELENKLKSMKVDA